MPEEIKIKKEDPKVDLDTSGPEVDVNLPEEKTEEACRKLLANQIMESYEFTVTEL